jgi:4-hydroxybenzoate polyprenyltransferase
MPALIRLLRPSQWLKNGFVFAPLIFSKHLFEIEYFLQSLIAFVAFCLASSLVYINNDILDKEADRLHPEKKKRPIASGEISIAIASSVIAILFALTIFITIKISILFTGIVLFYIVLQTFYSLKLKNVVILDVFIIAMGFMLRVFSGAVAIDVIISHWIVICTLFLSLFLAVSKRRSELVMIQLHKIETKRKVLNEYDINYLNLTLVITATGMAISYSLYTMAERTIETFGTEYLIFTTIFVLFGIFRYLYLVINKGMGENPNKILIKDLPMAVNILLYLVTIVSIIYLL